MAGHESDAPARCRPGDVVRGCHHRGSGHPRVMTEALVRLSTALTTGPPPETPLVLLQGTVVALGPPIRVDSGAMQLSCVSVQAVAVGATVYVIQSGGVNLVVGTSDGATVGLITAKRIRLGQA